MKPTRQSGALLVEVMIALTVFTIGVLAYLSTFRTIVNAGQDIATRDASQVALRNVAALVRNDVFGDLYTKYQGAKIAVTELEAPDGGPADVLVTCHVDETAIPAEFGALQDLDGDGMALSTDCSTTYRVLPVQLRLVYAASYGAQIRDVFLLVTDTIQ